MYKIYLKTFSILLYLILHIHCQVIPVQEIQIGQIVAVNYTFNKQENNYDIFYDTAVAFYHFKIQQVIPSDLLIVLVGERNYINSPTLFLSKIHQRPDGEEGDTICGWNGVEVCSIQNQNIFLNQNYYIGVYCLSDCQFQIKVDYQTEHLVNVGEQLLLKFNTWGAQIFKLIVPPQDYSDGECKILVQAFLQNPFDVNTEFKMYGNQGNIPPYSFIYDYYAIDIWSDGLALDISTSDPLNKWSINSTTNFTMIIEADANSQILVKSQIYGKFRIIQLNQQIMDIVQWNEKITYQLTLPFAINNLGNTTSLSFDLEPYYGQPELFVNYQSIPDRLDNYSWHLNFSDDNLQGDKRDGIASLTISNDEIQQYLSSQSQIFYVTVYGYYGATFRLLAYLSDYYDRDLVFDCTEIGYLKNGEQEKYQLYLFGISSTQITVKLNTITGSTVLYIKYCQQNDLCDLSQKDIEQRDKLVQQGSLFYTDQGFSSSFKQIQFYYNATKCNLLCSYSVTVVSTDTDPNLNCHYRLVARHKNSLINLKENQQIQSYLKIEDYEYYQFYVVPNDTSVQKIIIQVTAITGEFEVFLSRSNMFPNSSNYDKNGYDEIEQFQFNAQNNNLTGFYYVGIYAETTTTYNIQVQVLRASTICQGCIQNVGSRMYYGVPYTGLLYYNQAQIFYFYLPSNSKNFEITNVFIYFHIYFTNTSQKEYAYIYPGMKVYHKDVDGNIEEVQFDEVYETSNFIYYQIQTNLQSIGRYVIELKHNYDEYENLMFKFMIVINSDDIFQVIPEYGTFHYKLIIFLQGYISEVDSGLKDKYELFVATPSLVYFELFQCFGKLSIKASKNFDDLENNLYDFNQMAIGGIQSVNFHTLISYNITTAGSFYFAVISKPDAGFLNTIENVNESLYLIIPHLLGPNDVSPHQIFYPPQGDNAFRFQIKDTQTNSYNIYFQPLQYYSDYYDLNTLPYKIVKYFYILHVTDSQNMLPFYSQCDLDNEDLDTFLNYNQYPYHEKLYLSQYSLGTQELQFTIENAPNSTLYAQIMVLAFLKIQTDSEAQPFSFLYNEISVQHIQETNNNNNQNFNFTNNTKNNNNNTNSVNESNNNSQLQTSLPIQVEQKQSFWQKAIFSIIFMVIGGVLTLGCVGNKLSLNLIFFIILGYWIYWFRKRRGLLPPQIEMSDGRRIEYEIEQQDDAQEKQQQQQDEKETIQKVGYQKQKEDQQFEIE